MSAHKTLNTFVVYFKALFFLRYGHSTITAVWTDGLKIPLWYILIVNPVGYIFILCHSLTHLLFYFIADGIHIRFPEKV